jgi:hypothetical protein
LDERRRERRERERESEARAVSAVLVPANRGPVDSQSHYYLWSCTARTTTYHGVIAADSRCEWTLTVRRWCEWLCERSHNWTDGRAS